MDKKKREQQIRKLISREYKVYQEEERFRSLPQTLYEKACVFAERIHIEPDKKSKLKMQETIDLAHLKVTPTGISSLTIFFALIVSGPTLLLLVLNLLGVLVFPFGYAMVILILSMFFTYYIYTYPNRLRRKYDSEASAELVTFVLYVAMFLRNTPNLEGAVRFAADNLGGSLGYEIKKLLWDVEVANYFSMQEALTEYTQRWSKNRPFTESVGLMISSLKQLGEKRINLLDESVQLMLDGSREQARHFNQDLKTPVMVVHALGIILPVMGLVLFPVAAVFLGIPPTVLFVGYDIMLPLVLYFVISGILESRPMTFSKIDISESPEVPQSGKFFYGKKQIKAWPVALVVGLLIVSLGVFLYMNEAAVNGKKEGIVPAMVISLGIALGIGLYNILISKQRMKVRDKTRKVESEFAEALFQLGSQISGGMPVELSLEKSMERIKNLQIKDMFERAINNMKLMGFTFTQAFFDKDYGAVKYYPSKLIKSIMRTVTESTKKGVNTASVAMLSISKYLKGLHDTQEEVKTDLSDTINSIKFQSYFLSPLISGIVVTIAIVIIKILAQIGEASSKLPSSIGTGGVLDAFSKVNITPFDFIMIVSIYLIETSVILAMFVSSIESGEDPIGRQNTTGNSMIIGFTMFLLCMSFTLMIFGPLIGSVLAT
ncbi:MAG TPA: hypothetical protein VJI12_02780 [archaeon]|nr:hypothetical protein [archaeon]